MPMMVSGNKYWCMLMLVLTACSGKEEKKPAGKTHRSHLLIPLLDQSAKTSATTVNTWHGRVQLEKKIALETEKIKKRFGVYGKFHGISAPVMQNGRSGFYDTSGHVNWIKDHVFATYTSEMSGETSLTGEGEGLIAVKNKNGRYGFMDYNGQLVIACEYTGAGYFANGLANVEKDRKHGYIGRQGNTIVPLKYDDAAPFHENRARITHKDKMGFIDASGHEVITPRYRSAYFFSEGLCCVSMKDDYTGFFYIDSLGNTVLRGLYEQADTFRNGRATISQNGRCYEIDRTGKKLRSLPDCFVGC